MYHFVAIKDISYEEQSPVHETTGVSPTQLSLFVNLIKKKYRLQVSLYTSLGVKLSLWELAILTVPKTSTARHTRRNLAHIMKSESWSFNKILRVLTKLSSN